MGNPSEREQSCIIYLKVTKSLPTCQNVSFTCLLFVWPFLIFFHMSFVIFFNTNIQSITRGSLVKWHLHILWREPSLTVTVDSSLVSCLHLALWTGFMVVLLFICLIRFFLNKEIQIFSCCVRAKSSVSGECWTAVLATKKIFSRVSCYYVLGKGKWMFTLSI